MVAQLTDRTHIRFISMFNRNRRMFLGHDQDGIERELSSTLDCAALCRKHATCKSLAIPEACVFRMASTLTTKPEVEESHPKSLRSCFSLQLPVDECRPDRLDVLRGILPSLKMMVERDGELKKIDAAGKPDSHHDPLTYSIDPYGSDYFCRCCSHELSNVYLHCNGCEKFLSKDFNICSECYVGKRYEENIRMHPQNTKMLSDINHLGKATQNIVSKVCLSRQGNCGECKKCKHCSCRCHHQFTMHFRFRNLNEAEKLLHNCTNAAAKGAELSHEILQSAPVVVEQPAGGETAAYSFMYGLDEPSNVHDVEENPH